MRTPDRPTAFVSLTSNATGKGIRHWMGRVIVGCAMAGLVGASGCSGGGSGSVAPAKATASAEPAKAAVVSFLEAIKRGDDTAAAAMLTTVARTKTQELGLAVAPPVNPSARYEVRECEAVGDGGDLVQIGRAHV